MCYVVVMNSEYRGSEELGIPSYRDVTKMIPFENEATTNQQADELLRKFPAQSGNLIYASLDVRYPTKDSLTLELMAFILKGLTMKDAGTTDQMELYFSKFVIENKRYLQFPGILPFQAEMNLFLRRRSSAKDADEGSLNTTDSFPSPATVCGAVNTMLKLAQLDWTDFLSTSPLGKGVKDCEEAVRSHSIPERLRGFLWHLMHQLEMKDELSNLRVSMLPKRPQTTVSGQLESNIVLSMVYLFLWPYVRVVRDIVMEKEKQLKEYMLIMGLQPMALLLSWFLLYFFASIVLGVIAVIMLSGTMFVATQASGWYFFLLSVTFASSILLFGVSITPIFNQAKTAAAIASLVYFVLGAGPFIRSLVGEDAMDSSVVLNFFVSRLEEISSPVVFMIALRDIMRLDAITGAIRPIAWSTVSNPCQKMVLQSAGYLLLGWYLENVFPRTYGVQHRWYFVFQPSYWFPSFFAPARGLNEENAELLGLEELGQQDFDNSKDDTLREMPLREYVHQFKPILFVNSLSKRYPNGKEALKNVSFGVKKGEIFGLLGPNGAGKSTTMSILCGMLSPTSGDAIVGGYASVAKNPEAIRKSLSVCFQQNILFDELSVEEHLYLVCALKNAIGVKTAAHETWEAKLRQFGLLEKRDALSKTLSGGQKRKLSLVMALLDNSRVVLLDEPTAGMDLKARLDTWDALKRAVSHRAVILTTHLMQEAQALCENIGIVADGRLKCCGSSLFLREQFGVGYKLTLVHHEDDSGSDGNDQRRVSTSTLMQAVQVFVPKATLASDNKWETRIQLTDGKESSFVALFVELEAMKARREIKRYAIAATDLEDVFVKVTEGESVYYHAKDDVAGSSDAKTAKVKSELASYGTRDGTNATHRRASGFQIMSSQLRALFVKRGKMTLRDKKTIFAQYVWPIAIFAIILAAVQHLSMEDRSIETLTSLPLSASLSSFYLVASPPELSDRVYELLKHTNQDASRFVYREVESEQSMVDAIVSKENATSFFAAAYISRIRLPEDTDASSSSATEFAFGSFEFSLFYNRTISRSLPVGLEMLSEVYCRTLKSYLANGTAGADFESSCGLAVKTGMLEQHSPSFNGTSADEVDATSDGRVRINLSSDSNTTADLVSRVILTYYLLFTMSSIVSYYVSPIVKERESGLKRQQYLHLASRATSSLYWVSNFLFDFAVYLFAAAAVTLTVLMFTTSVPSKMLQVWFVGMVVFGVAMLPFTYLLSLVFSSHSSAQSFMSYASLFQIFAACVISGMSMAPALCTKVHTISYFLQFLPFYTFGMLVANVATVQFAPEREQCLRFSAQLGNGGFGDDDIVNLMNTAFEPQENTPSVWDWNVSGSSFAALFVSAVLYSLLLLAFDQKQMYPTLVSYKFSLGWKRVKRFVGFSSSPAADSIGYDAVPGSASADIENAKRSLVDVMNVTKMFNPKKATRAADTSSGDEAQEESGSAVLNQNGQVVALNDVSFSVEKNDCVALLGVNGSGKSTMFEILTAGTAPTQGRALIDNLDVTLEPKEASMQYGYCPQTNIFFSDLNVREHLELFYRLRSRQFSTIGEERAVVESLMGRLDLFPVEKTTAAHLSGGNKRRLMLALSLLSDDVSLLLLDEPSAGVDVVARRLMWRVLYEKRESSQRTSCLFTTHSMEEAEAVCANAVVLFKGNLVWCGSIPDLKQHVSRGVSISLRLDSAVVLAPERVAKYVDVVRNHVVQNLESRGLLERGLIRSEDLASVWNLCRQRYHPTFAIAHDNLEAVAPNHTHRENWITGVLAKLRTDNSTGGEGAVTNETSGAIAMDEFVKEWLIQEDFAALEQYLFQQQITQQSGEAVKSVDLQNAGGSGSNTNAVYETSCTDAFGLAALFGIMEASKSTFAIAQYSISELSLERVFEQFT